MKWFWLLLPLPVIPAAWWLLGSDAGYFLVWWLALSLIGWLVWPLASRMFPDGDRGYLLAKPLGLALSAFLLWTLAYLRILPFHRWAISLILCGLGLFAWVYREGWRNFYEIFSSRKILRRIACAELFFAAGLLFWTFARGLKPELDSLEKFMDIGFMNSLWRSDYLPAADMWLAGGKINYYYFGQYVYTFLAKLAGIRPEIAYNLGMAATFAFTLVLSYAVVSQLLAQARRAEPRLPEAIQTAGGLLASGLVAFAGNSHAFFYDPGSIGKRFLTGLQALGLTGANAQKFFWFADSTRFIGYNPETADKTIHEFPYYSFLVADLHAHVINLAFVLLLLAILVRLSGHPALLAAADNCRKMKQRRQNGADHSWQAAEMMQLRLRFRTNVLNGPLFLLGFLLALFIMGNFWDFAIYFVVTILVLVMLNYRGYGRLARLPGLLAFGLQGLMLAVPFLTVSQPVLAVGVYLAVLLINHYLSLSGDALTLTGAQMSWLFFLAHLLSLPFGLSFEPISKSIALAVSHTPFWQLMILWGPHLLAGLLFVFFMLFRYHSRNRLRLVFPPAPEDRSAISRQTGGMSHFIASHNPADLLAVIFFIYAAGLILVPELLYVVDIYSGEYKRANTMFKFTYQAFVLLSLVWAYATIRVISSIRKRRAGQRRWPAIIIGVLLVVSILIPGKYPFVATGQWLGEFSRERYLGLDGLALLAEKDSVQIDGEAAGELSADYAAILWLNAHVSGQPVILEASGDSYTDFCRISAFTGLPTVFGWQTHEWLWRTSKAVPDAYHSVVVPRQEDVRLLYAGTDQAVRLELIKKYQVAYIIIGDLERQKYSEILSTGNWHSLVQEDLLLDLGTLVFQDQSLLIIQVSG